MFKAQYIIVGWSEPDCSDAEIIMTGMGIPYVFDSFCTALTYARSLYALHTEFRIVEVGAKTALMYLA